MYEAKAKGWAVGFGFNSLNITPYVSCSSERFSVFKHFAQCAVSLNGKNKLFLGAPPRKVGNTI